MFTFLIVSEADFYFDSAKNLYRNVYVMYIYSNLYCI